MNMTHAVRAALGAVCACIIVVQRHSGLVVPPADATAASPLVYKPRGAGDARRRNIHTHMNASSTPTHTTYGIPILLEDRTGHLAGSDFVDIHDRLRLRLRCTARAPTHTAYEICRLPTATSAFASSAVIGLTFGPCDALGIITVGGWPAVPMDEYLGKVAPSGRSATRVLVAGVES